MQDGRSPIWGGVTLGVIVGLIVGLVTDAAMGPALLSGAGLGFAFGVLAAALGWISDRMRR